METENWINEILESTAGMQPAIPSDALFSRIQNSLQEEKTIAPQWVWLAAASIAILVSINVKLVFFKSHKEKSATESYASSLTKSNQLY